MVEVDRRSDLFEGRKTMRRWLTRSSIGLVGTMVLMAGCGTDPFAPPPSPKPIGEDAPAAVQTLFLISPLAPDSDVEGWVSMAQREANDRGLVFRVLGPQTGESSTAEPLVVRRALNDGASALLVIPSTAFGLGQALAEAESKKVPVVVIGRTIPVVEGSTPFTVVVPEPFSISAEKIVSTTLDDAKQVGLPANGTALIVTERETDTFVKERVDALKLAAEKAGLKARVVEFDGPVSEPAAMLLTREILATSDLSVVLAGGESAMQLAAKVRQELLSKAKFLLGGYIAFKNGLAPNVFAGESCTVEFRTEELARLGVTTAIDRLKGNPAGVQVEMALKFKKLRGITPVGADGLIEPGPEDPTVKYKRSTGVEVIKKP